MTAPEPVSPPGEVERLLAAVDQGRGALARARGDFDRLRVRDQAAAAAAAAAILDRRDIQTAASILVADAERAIARANPPAKPGPKTPDNSVIPDHGITRDVLRQMRAAHDHLDDDEYAEIVADAIERQEPVTRQALKARKVRRRIDAAARRRAAIEALPRSEDPPVLHVCSCLELADRVEPGSVDLILTDPPYERKHLDAWRELGYFAGRSLKRGGLMLALSGNIDLPGVIDRVRAGAESAGGGLDWWYSILWDMTGGGNVAIIDRRLFATWKQLLGWTAGPRSAGPAQTDRITPEKEDTGLLHKWGQPVGGFAAAARKWAKPGDLIVDPFVGAGTSGAAAMLRGCRFIGGDIDPGHVATARRLLDA